MSKFVGTVTDRSFLVALDDMCQIGEHKEFKQALFDVRPPQMEYYDLLVYLAAWQHHRFYSDEVFYIDKA